MTCPACASNRLTAIQIRLAPDEDHTFASCQACSGRAGSRRAATSPWARSWPWPASAGSDPAARLPAGARRAPRTAGPD